MAEELTFAERRDRVRQAVIEPLEAMGMRKPGSMTRDAFEAFKVRLAERLAWLSPEWHGALVEIVERGAVPSARKRDGGRPARDIWPSEVAILNWARGLQPAMVGVTRLVGTYMRSQAGWEALARSPYEASRLERHLRVHGRPPEVPGGFEMIAREAAELERQIAEVRERIRVGIASYDDRERLERWDAREKWLRHLVLGDLDRDPGLAA